MDFGPSFSGGRRDTLTPQQARVKWLEREVEALKGLMQDQVKRETSTYWDHTFPTKISSVPCRGTAPNLTLDLNAKGHAHLFWDAREVTAEGSEIPLRGYRAFSASVPLHPAT